MPQGASKVQLQEMEKAFYSGAYALLCAVIENSNEQDNPTDKDQAGMIEKLHQEILTKIKKNWVR